MIVMLDQCPASVSRGRFGVRSSSRLFFYFIVLLCFNVSHAYVQVCAADAVDDHCLVPSLGIPTVWLCSLLALSLWCLGDLTAAI